uniref:hypothetical protein n=1 Tax=Burkholderia sp. AU33423 TaxID=2015355 RepID=UPI00118062FD|nr:hypothetical protein [Burkholderia sp. AU33423]
MDAHVEPRRDDQGIVGKRALSAHGQLLDNSLGQLDGARNRIAIGKIRLGFETSVTFAGGFRRAWRTSRSPASGGPNA